MQGNTPMQQGQGPGLSLRDLGELGGEQSVTLLQTEMPSHNHGAMADGTGKHAAGHPSRQCLGLRTEGRRQSLHAKRHPKQ